MDAAKQQSIMQGGIIATLTVAAIFGGITYLTEGAVDWSLLWIIVFMTSLPWAIYLYWMQ